MLIGISGTKGSFSEEAAIDYCQKEGLNDIEYEYLTTVEGVLTAIEKGDIDLGIFPIENSNGGIVYESVHAMSGHIFNIKKLFEIDIHHCLLVRSGVKRGEIKKVASHPQALKQCRMYLKRQWGEVELVEKEDTAKSALDLKKGKLGEDCAVIASKTSASIYGLDILEESIQDLKFNFTTFIAAVKRS